MPSKRKNKTSHSTRPGSATAPRRHKGEQVDESDQILWAIRHGKIDALVTDGSEGQQILTLLGAENPYHVVLDTINDGAATLDPAGTVLYANNRFAEILQVPGGEGALIGNTLEPYFSPLAYQHLQKLMSEGLSDNARGEITLQSPGGRARLMRLVLKPLRNGDETNVCVVATELTELMEANAALRSNEESLRQLSARLLKLQDEERRHIARDLHDITGQKLAAQSMTLSQVLNRKPSSLDEESRVLLQECSTLSKQVCEEIRTLSYLLHPPLLDELGLSSAVKWYVEGFERRTGIQIEMTVDPDFGRLSPDVEVTLFRVIQESLANVHRYSGSPKAYVRLKFGKKVEVQIGDFGKGIQPMLSSTRGKVAPLGVGIQGMRERMRQLGGKLEITSRPKHGTVVTATIPIEESQDPTASAPAMSQLPSNGDADASSFDSGQIRKKILIADDHEMLRRGIRNALAQATDWEICGEAVDGQDAVEQVARLSPDLVILDINMPVLNGLAAVRQILRSRPQTKILVFTVHESEQTVKEIKAAGAHAYLSKNNASDDLVRVVRDLVGLQQSTQGVAAIRN